MEFIIRRNESLDEYKIKKRLNNYCLYISMEMIFMDAENNKMSS